MAKHSKTLRRGRGRSRSRSRSTRRQRGGLYPLMALLSLVVAVAIAAVVDKEVV